MSELLEIRDLHAGYGFDRVLQGVELDIGRGQVVALLGRNGVGKTTLVHTIMGLIKPASGSIRFEGRELAGLRPHSIARSGIGLVPQGRRIFTRLTVDENLRLAQQRRNGDWTLDAVYGLLPQLAQRRRNRGSQLSGGEQQMLALARVLLGNPRLMLFDEPSEGLAPLLIEDVTRTISDLCAKGISALLVEQNLRVALELADVVHVMAKGRIVYQGTVSEFQSDPDAARTLLGVF